MFWEQKHLLRHLLGESSLWWSSWFSQIYWALCSWCCSSTWMSLCWAQFEKGCTASNRTCHLWGSTHAGGFMASGLGLWAQCHLKEITKDCNAFQTWRVLKAREGPCGTETHTADMFSYSEQGNQFHKRFSKQLKKLFIWIWKWGGRNLGGTIEALLKIEWNWPFSSLTFHRSSDKVVALWMLLLCNILTNQRCGDFCPVCLNAAVMHS